MLEKGKVYLLECFYLITFTAPDICSFVKLIDKKCVNLEQCFFRFRLLVVVYFT